MQRDYSVYDRCPIHDCVMLIVATDAKPQCMVDWLLKRTRGQWVRDYVPREDYYGDLVLTNHVALPVESLKPDPENTDVVFPLWESPQEGVRLNALSALHLVDVGYGRTEYGEELILFKFEVLDTGVHVIAKAQFDELFDNFYDEEIRKYEP